MGFKPCFMFFFHCGCFSAGERGVVGCLGSLLYLLGQFLRWLEDAARADAAHKTLGTLTVVVKGALFAKVVAAIGDNRVLEVLSAYEAGKWKLVLRITAFVLTGILCAIVTTLHLLVQLPPTLVVASIMHELAAVAIAAETGLLVILADVRLVIPPNCAADVLRRSNRTWDSRQATPGMNTSELL